jgi:hypothetical protein
MVVNRSAFQKVFLAIIFLLIREGTIDAQTTYNPYSMFGTGELELGEYGSNAGMAGTGIGIRNADFLNTLNPASVSALDSMTFLFDFAGSVKWSKFISDNDRENTANANLKKLVMGFRVAPRWAVGLGIEPYSSVGYLIKSSQDIEGINGSKVDVKYNGHGGINKFFISNAFRITPKISFGINTSYLLGSLYNGESINGWYIEKTSDVSKFYFDFGMQYTDLLANNISCVFGFIYGYGSTIVMNNNLEITDDNGKVLQNKSAGAEKQELPMYYGVGVSACLNNAFTFAADYQYQKSSKIESNFPNVYYTDMNKFKIGLEFRRNNNTHYNNYLERIRYQTGFTIGNSYLKINGNNPIIYGICAGLVLPVKSSSIISLSVEIGKAGSSLIPGQIQENYTKFNFSLNFKDIWFLKRKFD